MHTRIPPPLIVALLAALMGFANSGQRNIHLEFALQRPLAIALATLGLLLMLAAALHLLARRTTVNPLHPERATQLLSTGTFALSRNPIYLGDLLLLAAWALWLGNLENLVFLGLFVWYLNRFQIEPEERALQALFGEAFTRYCQRVRRWV